MQERAAAAHLVLERAKAHPATRLLIVAPLTVRGDPVARRDDDAHRPQLHVELPDVSRLERLGDGVRVVRAVLGAELRVEPPVRGAQPALSHRRMGVERALEDELLAVRVEDAQHEEDVRVADRRRTGTASRTRGP